MNTWISRPSDGDTREWHLIDNYEVTVPAARIVMAECSASIIVSDGFETATTDEVPEARRCSICQGILLRDPDRT